MRRGFTLIEILVASILLAMLVTILTMVFNQSSIAWRTGTAGVAKLQDARRQLGAFHDCRDDALPGLMQKNAHGSKRKIQYRTTSLFQRNSNKLKNDRAFENIVWEPAPPVVTAEEQGEKKNVKGGERNGSTYTVGVRSAGPNGKFGDEDDITTWPAELF